MSHHKDPIVTKQYNEKSQGSHGISAIDAFPSAPAHLQKVGLMFPFGKLQRTILSTINQCVEQWHFILTWVWIKYILIYWFSSYTYTFFTWHTATILVCIWSFLLPESCIFFPCTSLFVFLSWWLRVRPQSAKVSRSTGVVLYERRSPHERGYPP